MSGRSMARLTWRRVLIVEDNPANMKLAVFLLESAGHTVSPPRTPRRA